MSKSLHGFDLSSFWKPSQYAAENYVDGSPTPETVKAVERQLGFKLPAAYIELAKVQNGGFPRHTSYRTDQPTSWATDHVAINGIYSIGGNKLYSLCGETFNSRFWEQEWGYPAIGVYFADCPSAGHDMIALDYRESGPDGEPQVVHVDQEADYRITKIAGSFAEFIRRLEPDDAFGSGDESGVDRAIRKNDLDHLRQMIAAGHDLEATDEYDRTMIENAAIQNQPEVIELLASAGASLRNALSIAEGNLPFFPEHKASVLLLRKLAASKANKS
jgi:hypothetical protein